MGGLFVLLALVDAPTVSLTSTSACPSAGQLESALVGAVPDVHVVGEPARPGDLRVELVDFGDRYRISIDGTTARELPDPARRCEQRARAAAVVIALALAPHEAPPPPAPPAPSPQVVDIDIGRVVEPRPRARARRFDLEAAARLDTAPAADGGTVGSIGVGVRGALMGSRFGVTAGAGYQSSTTLELLVPVALVRIPLDVGARLRLAGGRWSTAFDLGLAASILTLDGPHLGGTRLDVGVRGAIAERLELGSRLSPFVALEMTWSPRPYDLLVDGIGIEGQTPSVWIGWAAGVAMHFP